MTPGLRRALLDAGHDWRPEPEHLDLVRRMAAMTPRRDTAMSDLLLRAALCRGFMG